MAGGRLFIKVNFYDKIKIMKNKIFIGTSGYLYQHWREIFYPKDLSPSKWLEFYCQNFDTVELNVTFYRLPSQRVFESWHKRAPQDFTFAVKGSRFITHIKKLKEIKNPLELFFSRTENLKEKLGVVLWQFPSNFKVGIEKLEKFLVLCSKFKVGRQAMEFRHQSWFSKEVYDLLKKYNVALVIPDSPHWPSVEEITADFTYLRFHGGRELYGSNYSSKELKNWASKIKRWQRQNLDIYAYFNNDAYGYALKNAKALKKLVNQ